MRYGNLREISVRLDRKMAEHFEAFGPFRFTASMLVYDSGHEFQMIPYDQIVSAEIEATTADDPAAIVVRTRKGRQYQWYRTWMQGIFDADAVLEKIRSVIPATDIPATDEQSSTTA